MFGQGTQKLAVHVFSCSLQMAYVSNKEFGIPRESYMQGTGARL